MKNLHLYTIPIAYMLVYIVAILVSGVWLFLLSQGLASADILQTLTNIVNVPESKSLHNFIEVATPHMFAMGTLIFVVAHFMLFSTNVSQKFSLIVSLVFFTVALFNISAYLFISFGLVVSGWIKLFSIVLFVFVFTVMLGLVAFSL